MSDVSMFSLEGKTMIVTGASKGIGLAIAEGFAREGAKVSICARNAETLEQARAHDHMNTKLGPNQGRGIATAFWNTLGMETSATININQDGLYAKTGLKDEGIEPGDIGRIRYCEKDL